MYLFNSLWHVISAALVFFGGLLIAHKIGRKFYIEPSFSVLIYLWHTFFCLVYVKFAMSTSADANRYFNSDNLDFISFKFGTVAVELLTSLLRFIDFSYLGCFLFYNIIGFVGLISVAGSINIYTKNANKQTKMLGLIFIFLPSISFWSSAIGKDAISFMATGLALWASLNFKRRKLIMVTAILSMLFVRPHIAAIMLIAVSISLIFDKKVGTKMKVGLFLISLISTSVMVPFALKYAGVDNTAEASDLSSYIAMRQNSNLDGGSSVDIASMPLPIKMFTYLFRPLPNEARSITTLFASIDNILLLFIFILGFKHVRRFTADGTNRTYMWTYSFGTLLILSLTTANLGIAMRQKWMFVPLLAYLFLSAIAQNKKHHK
jgi:hypothetical protein